MEKTSKTKKILAHLKRGQSITTWDAIRLYNATRLSGHIYVLRKQGYDIESIDVKNKNDNYTHAVYRLKI